MQSMKAMCVVIAVRIIAYTVFIFAHVMWVVVASFRRNPLLGRLRCCAGPFVEIVIIVS
jgi:hypothetical protein